jgi:hypothetical protein
VRCLALLDHAWNFDKLADIREIVR